MNSRLAKINANSAAELRRQIQELEKWCDTWHEDGMQNPDHQGLKGR